MKIIIDAIASCFVATIVIFAFLGIGGFVVYEIALNQLSHAIANSHDPVTHFILQKMLDLLQGQL